MILVWVVAPKFLDDMAFVNEPFKLFKILGEVDFACYDWVEPSFDDVPYTYGNQLTCQEFQGGLYKLWKIQGDLWTRTTPKLSG